MLVFIAIKNNCIENTYKSIALVVSMYWGLLSLLRIYVILVPRSHGGLIESTNKIGVGVVAIIIGLIYLLFKYVAKSER